jgi:WD40 repeat protein
MPNPAAQKQITTTLSTQKVRLSGDQATAVFDATVYNDSDRFASFQVKLLAAGALTDGRPWYRLTPSVSAKIPVGDCTRFQVEIFDLPPIAQQFRGTIDLTVEVTSRELVNQYDRQQLQLLADGLQGQPPTISLLLPVLEGNPGDRVAIVAQVANPTRSPQEATLRLLELPETWFPEGTQQILSLLPGKPQKVSFQCEIPSPLEAPSQLYPLRLEATGRFPSVTTTGQFQVLPAGTLSFTHEPTEAVIPDPLGTWLNPTHGTAEFALQFDNLSNLATGVQVAVQELRPKRRWQQQQTLPPLDFTQLPPDVTLGELPLGLPIGITAVPLQIHRRLPWLGWSRSRQFEVTAQSLNPAIPLQPASQTLKVHLFPVIPFWLQLLAAILTLGLGALTWFLLSDPGHRAAVNSVRFSGQGTEVLSGSDDQTVRRWRVQNQSLQTQTRIGDLNRAVRVVRYRPVNNDQMAMGFENGEIQVANLLTGQRSRLTPDKDDRVFDLVFSRDARTLFSAHGSGLVLGWDIGRFNPDQTQPLLAYDTKFAIQSAALVGDDDTHLAVGGRYNRLMILDVAAGAEPAPNPGAAGAAKPAAQAGAAKPAGQPDPNNPDGEDEADDPNDPEAAAPDRKVQPIVKPTNPAQKPRGAATIDKSAPKPGALVEIAYPSGGAADYISSLSAADQQPNLLAVADTKGQLSLWDMQECLQNRGRCQATDTWLGQGGNPVRSVALSADGCFLASAGDDGVVRLWPLDGQGSRRSSALEGRVLGRTNKALNAVDVIQTRTAVWVTSGGADGQVRLYSVQLAAENRVGDRCPVLTGGG